MEEYKDFIFSIFIVVIMLLLLKKTGFGCSVADVWQNASHDLNLIAQIEREQEEIAYQKAIRWSHHRRDCFDG